ncbi:Nuclease-related domain-containing protein [Halobacillus dabanensis]|uniref:Nuclease-related domain-containing protein n=1 Tax=Halobacillus dabanensis TaxID=240302 RepID=A0A1I3NMN5_HALDA|nr:nuclease-related domain-containing protein [Halobacillus dabanensis]SFJ10412.1 Nuclease-related domain-containing protein [Halobacillus dabanensis]
MAQLIKLKDYISRYEVNIFQYPTQYIRLKNDNWKKMGNRFEKGMMEDQEEFHSQEIRTAEEDTGWRKFFKRKKEELEHKPEKQEDLVPVPTSIGELKQYYLDGLLPFQMKWATTTLKEKSFIDNVYQEDPYLKYFLQRFPDTYLLMYEPVALMKKAEVEIDHLLIGPFGIDIITSLSHPSGTILYPTTEHSWHIEGGDGQQKIRNPMLSLRRTETFIKSILSEYQLDFPYRKVILAPDLEFGPGQEPYQTAFIGKHRYQQWFNEKRNTKSPLKHDQLKVAEALLKHCRTVAVRRPEWDMEEDFMEK